MTDCQALVKRRLLHKYRCGGRGTPRGEVIHLSPDDCCFRVQSLSVAAGVGGGGGGVNLKLAAKARGDCLSAARPWAHFSLSVIVPKSSPLPHELRGSHPDCALSARPAPTGRTIPSSSAAAACKDSPIGNNSTQAGDAVNEFCFKYSAGLRLSH